MRSSTTLIGGLLIVTRQYPGTVLPTLSLVYVLLMIAPFLNCGRFLRRCCSDDRRHLRYDSELFLAIIGIVPRVCGEQIPLTTHSCTHLNCSSYTRRQQIFAAALLLR